VYPARLRPGSAVARAYGDTIVYERHRHRWEFNSRYRRRLEDAGLLSVGTSPDDRLVEFVELAGHPFWVGTQAHPEFKSRPDRPHPLFRAFVGVAMSRAAGRTEADVAADAADILAPDALAAEPSAGFVRQSG